jgi:hypothetical protein
MWKQEALVFGPEVPPDLKHTALIPEGAFYYLEIEVKKGTII